MSGSDRAVGSRVDSAGGRLRVSVPLRLPVVMSVIAFFSMLCFQDRCMLTFM